MGPENIKMRVHDIVEEQSVSTDYPSNYTINYITEDALLLDRYWRFPHHIIPVLNQKPCMQLIAWYRQIRTSSGPYNVGFGIIHAQLALAAKYEDDVNAFQYYFAMSYNHLRKMYQSGHWTLDIFIALSLLVHYTL
jgi:hypothetical protein